MTPKEALDILRNRVSKLALNHKIGNRDIANLEVKDIVMSIETHVIPTFEQALTELEALKRYPTQKEVCEAIMKHYRGKVVFYNEMARTFNEVHITRNEETVSFYANGEVGINYNGLPPHLITLIGRFYEGMEKGEGK